MDILSSINQAMFPGQRVQRVNGWEGLKAFKMPRDSEGIFLDIDDSKNFIYMKKVDSNGIETCARYSYEEAPYEEFDPVKYATKKDLEQMKEDIVNGFDSKLSELLELITERRS